MNNKRAITPHQTDGTAWLDLSRIGHWSCFLPDSDFLVLYYGVQGYLLTLQGPHLPTFAVLRSSDRLECDTLFRHSSAVPVSFIVFLD